MTDTEFSYRSSQGGINIYNLATNTATEMISGILVVSIPFDSFLILKYLRTLISPVHLS